MKGKYIKFSVDNFKINVYQADTDKPGTSVVIQGHFKALSGVNYINLYNYIKKEIKSLISKEFGKQNIVIVDIPNRIIINRNSNISIEFVINYNGDCIKKDFIFIDRIKSIIDIIIKDYIFQFKS